MRHVSGLVNGGRFRFDTGVRSRTIDGTVFSPAPEEYRVRTAIAGCIAASLALLASCDTGLPTPPGTVRDLAIESHLDEVYEFSWSDPQGTVYSSIDLELRPLGITASVAAGVESASIPVPATEQILLLVARATTAGGISGEPTYLVWPGEQSAARINFYDAASVLVEYNDYIYDAQGRETGFETRTATAVFVRVRDRSNFSPEGVFGVEVDYSDLARTVLEGSATLEIDHRYRLLAFTNYDSFGDPTSRLQAVVGAHGRIGAATITDPSGVPVQRQHAVYGAGGRLAAYEYRDLDSALLSTEEFAYDEDGRLVGKVERDASGFVLRRLEYVYD